MGVISMANYRDVLTLTGHKLTGKETEQQLKSLWKDYRTDYKAKYGESAPSIYKMQQYANTEIPTLDFGRDYILNFLNKVDEIYRDTVAYIDANKEGTHESGKLASIGEYTLYSGELIERKLRIEEIVRDLVNEYGSEVVAQAIADNVELDYTIAISLVPPSDIFFEMDETISQLLALTTQMEARAEELAIEQENEYYGQ